MVQRIARIRVNDFEVGGTLIGGEIGTDVFDAIRFDQAIAIKVEAANLVGGVGEVDASVHAAGDAHDVSTQRRTGNEVEGLGDNRSRGVHRHVNRAEHLRIRVGRCDLRVETRCSHVVSRNRVGLQRCELVQQRNDRRASVGCARSGELAGDKCFSVSCTGGDADVLDDNRRDLGVRHASEVARDEGLHQSVDIATIGDAVHLVIRPGHAGVTELHVVQSRCNAGDDCRIEGCHGSNSCLV